jgi:hypothetical protein
MNHRFEATVGTPLPGMGGLYCLPTYAEIPYLETAPDSMGLAWSPFVLTQANLEEVCLADIPNNDPDALEALVLFHPSPAAQGDERRSGNMIDHTTTDATLTGDVDDAIIGTQVTMMPPPV